MAKPSRVLASHVALLLLTACGDVGTGTSGSTSPTPSPTPTTPTPTPTPFEPSQDFVARVNSGQGSRSLTDAPPSLTFFGCLKKAKTTDPRVLGAADFLTNLSGHEYRITKFSYTLDTTGLLPGEAAESDIGFTILPKTEVVALNSGEEILVTHRYDTKTADRGVTHVTMPLGGIALLSDHRLSVGSVSGVFPQSGGGAKNLDDVRVAGGGFMRLCYSTELTRADAAMGEPVTSYRSPFRDRSYVSNPGRLVAPFTDFKNNSTKNVRIYGVTVFLSNLTDSERSKHRLQIGINGNVIQEIPLPDHIPGVETELFPTILPLDITVKPGDTVSIRGIITPDRAIVYDFVAFIYADVGLLPVNEKFKILDADLNGDGFNDIVDIDAVGTIWVSLRVGGGLQDTQGPWANSLRNVQSLNALPRASLSDPLYIRAQNDKGLCLNLRSAPLQGRFVLDYCHNTTALSSDSDVWGDFNGDGWIDRMRRSASSPSYLVALGGAAGLTSEEVWLQGLGQADRMFVSDVDGDGMDDIEVEFTEAGKFKCTILISRRSRFDQMPCS